LIFLLWDYLMRTLPELRTAGVGQYHPNRTPGWDRKKVLYQECGVWTDFTRLRSQYVLKFTDPATRISDTNQANRSAQIEIDARLVEMVTGVGVPVPAESSVDDEFLVDADIFSDCGEVFDIRRDLIYVCKNLSVKNADPKDAPSSFAYGVLRHVQSDSEKMDDFLYKMVPKIIPKDTEDSQSYHDDMREQFKILERLAAEA